jgi:hypothetical protein
MDINNYHNYLVDFIFIQLDKLNQLKEEISSCQEEDKDFIKGQIMAYYDTLDRLKSEAENFDINLKELENVNLETYLTCR